MGKERTDNSLSVANEGGGLQNRFGMLIGLQFRPRRLSHQDEAAGVKTDRNPKETCLCCTVDIVSNPTPACGVSSRSSY
ncbi:hypothetical protein AVEN_62676-1 [Araneus ventricosus]|uniref:Uncharacterized protein n=1 Tax=Araneus ventricosus TaxID=182803 RepID=A0A4Y2FJG1_ARAVE|nr:hypothetical protein AVEN_62676-1 [Araneus ventricosus]